ALVFEGGRVEKFSILGRPDRIGLEEVLDLPLQRGRLKEAVARGDEEVLRTFDPFAEVRPEDELGSGDEAPLAGGVFPLFRWRGVVAAVVGLVIALVLEQRILPAQALAEARRENTVWAYRALLKEHPVRWAEEEARAAIASRRAEALSRFRERAAPGDPRV